MSATDPKRLQFWRELHEGYAQTGCGYEVVCAQFKEVLNEIERLNARVPSQAPPQLDLYDLVAARRERASVRAAVTAWMDNQGRLGELCQASQAPGWSRYNAVEEAYQQALARFEAWLDTQRCGCMGCVTGLGTCGAYAHGLPTGAQGSPGMDQ